MSTTTTISVRVPKETRDWLERRTRKMGTVGTAAARLLEEARRREAFRGVEFRDTPAGRLAYVSATRVPAHLFARTLRDYDGDPERIAEHYRWPLWKVESAAAYAEAFAEEIREDDAAIAAMEDFVFSSRWATPSSDSPTATAIPAGKTASGFWRSPESLTKHAKFGV